jgi:hypothetical protein
MANTVNISHLPVAVEPRVKKRFSVDSAYETDHEAEVVPLIQEECQNRVWLRPIDRDCFKCFDVKSKFSIGFDTEFIQVTRKDQKFNSKHEWVELVKLSNCKND